MKLIHTAALPLLLLLSNQAFSIDKSITVTTTIPALLDIVNDDLTPLKNNIDLKVSQDGLIQPYDFTFKLVSNQLNGKSYEFKIKNNVNLKTNAGVLPININLSLDGSLLTPNSSLRMDEKSLFGSSSAQAATSKSLILSVFANDPVARNYKSGIYTGAIDLVVTQAP